VGGADVAPPADPTLRDFERLAQLLRLDAVGVAEWDDGSLGIRWWARSTMPLPAPVADLLAGTVPGWIALDLPAGGHVFARLTEESSHRTSAALQAIGPLLLAEHGAEDQPDAASISATEAALRDLRHDLGFETASLFVRGAGGWELLARHGATKAWHAVLEPTALGGTPEAAEYPDARAIPGIGERLAALGCASVASIAIPHGGRILLDSSNPCPEGGWMERARPLIELANIMAGPGWAAGSALRSFQEVGVLNDVFAAIREVLERPGGSPDDLLDSVREAIRAQELFLLTERQADVQVLSSPQGGWPRRLPDRFRELMASTGDPGLSEESTNKLSTALGIPSVAVSGAFGRDREQVEVLLAGWADGLVLSPVTMAVVAGAVCTARSALQNRRQAVNSLLDRERTRMAYALHDGLVQTVTSAVLELELLRKRFDRDPDGALSTLDSARAEIRGSLADLRSMMFDLTNAPIPEEDRSAEPITEYVEDVVRRWRLPAQVVVRGSVNEVPTRVLSVAYVVIREALANAAKHAGSGKVMVTLALAGGTLSVGVQDGGRGFTSEDERMAREAHHFGLDMLRRRVREAGGELAIESTPGRGTEVLARIPIEEGAR
jgi:signal transduction histidine kinase